MPNVIGDKWLTTTYELVFWVDEPNMAAVDVAIYNGDDAEPREVLMPERIDAPASLGLSGGRRRGVCVPGGIHARRPPPVERSPCGRERDGCFRFIGER